jgi:hypothetical protein
LVFNAKDDLHARWVRRLVTEMWNCPGIPFLLPMDVSPPRALG